jgi:hypothetical protein
VSRISVRTTSPISVAKWAYLVAITKNDGSGSTTGHKVILDRSFYDDASKGVIMPEEFVRRSVQFLVSKNGNKLQDEFDLGDLVLRYPDYHKYISNLK